MELLLLEQSLGCILRNLLKRKKKSERVLIMKTSLEGIPALIYSNFWHTRELGFLDQILKKEKVKEIRAVFLFKDYLPGALLILDGIHGDYEVRELESLEDIEYDCLIEGPFQEYLKLMSISFNLTKERLTDLIRSKKFRIKGIYSLFKLSKVYSNLVF